MALARSHPGATRPAVIVALAAIVAGLLSGGLAASTRAQQPPTGRQVALGLEAACGDRVDTRWVIPEEGDVAGQWITVAGPDFGLQPGQPRPRLLAHAVDPVDPRRILVSEGASIQLSEDGGCSWTERHFEPNPRAVNLEGEIAVAQEIRQLEFGGEGADRRPYALLAPDESQIGAVRVLVSDNAGADWEERSAGLPPAYTRYDSSALDCPAVCPTALLATSPNEPDVAYVSVPTHLASALFRTEDGGLSWQTMTGAAKFGGHISEMAVSAGDPRDVWAVFTDRLGRSRDGGETWEFPQGLDRVGGLHLSSGVSPPVVQILRRPELADGDPRFRYLMRSVDGGATFSAKELATPFDGVPAAAIGGSPDEIVIATARPPQVFKLDAPAGELIDIGVVGLGEVAAPRRHSTAEPATWFRKFSDLAIFLPGAPPAQKRPQLMRPGASPQAPPRVPGELVPNDLHLDLGPEGSRVVDYRLVLPPLPTPVDIWFLVDTSASMSGATEGLRQGFRTIAQELRSSGFDAWFGLATFPARSAIYERQADIAPPNAEFYGALDRLTTDGTSDEQHVTALYQSVTGAGMDNAIPPGRGATFRPSALKIIVHATDEAYAAYPPGPSMDEMTEVVAAAGVRHIGLDLAAGAPDPLAGADAGGPRSTKRDHDTMALVTNTLAPPGGIDCNGDGTVELQEGDPVTCPIERDRDTLQITPAIVAAVRAVRDDTAVALKVIESGGLAVEIGNSVHPSVNVKTPNSLLFPVRYTCPAEMTGKVANVLLRATVRGAPSAGGVARIGCGVPAPASAAAPFSRAERSQPAAAPLVVAAPQITPELEPGLSPLNQTSPAQVGSPSAQPGMAGQPAETAPATQRAGRDRTAPTQVDGMGSRRDENLPAAAGTIGAGAALAVALGGWALRSPVRRNQPVVVHAIASNEGNNR